MSINAGILIYLTLYRLTVLSIGALSIWLGFRLFIHSADRPGSTDKASSANAEAGGFKLTLTNFLPGTYFALFGTMLIGIMLWQSSPQFSRKELVETTAKEGGGVRSQRELIVRLAEVNLDGEPKITLEQEWEKLKPGVPVSGSGKNGPARLWQWQDWQPCTAQAKNGRIICTCWLSESA